MGHGFSSGRGLNNSPADRFLIGDNPQIFIAANATMGGAGNHAV
jgi:hypothetical protein